MKTKDELRRQIRWYSKAWGLVAVHDPELWGRIHEEMHEWVEKQDE